MKIYNFTPLARRQSRMKQKTVGIILIMLVILVVIGGIINGLWVNLGNENIITASTEVIIPIILLIIGIRLIKKAKD